MVRAIENDPHQEAIDEAILMELIYRAWNIYLLTKKGAALMREGKTYADFLTEIEPVKPKKHSVPQEISLAAETILRGPANDTWLIVLITCLLASLLLFIIFKM